MTLEQLIDQYLGNYAAGWATNIQFARGDGWALFNTDDPLRCGIERMDDAAIFEDDQAAVVHVAEAALAGSAFHAHTLIIHHLCDELRAKTWGPSYALSRLGPA